MVKAVHVKGVAIGTGTAKIIVPVMPVRPVYITRTAEHCRDIDFDILEWRADYMSAEHAGDYVSAAKKLRGIFRDKPLLFTFRSEREGGRTPMGADDYIDLNRSIIKSGYADMIDLEFATESGDMPELIETARKNNVKVILSCHDFNKTPSITDIVDLFRKMQDMGADIVKIAVMPRNTDDVIRLLDAANEMNLYYSDRPMIAISMGGMGALTRLVGEVFGSCATYGSALESSAPGQIEAKHLRGILDIMHKNLES